MGFIRAYVLLYELNDCIKLCNTDMGVYVVLATMGAIFGMGTCLSAQAREAPDDPLNYFFGGCASGIFLGAKSRYQSRHWL